MKEQKPKGKTQIPQSGPQAPDGEPSPLHRHDDDVDFEILDALEQIEQVGKETGESLSDDDDAIALNLDDEDLVFDDEEIPETEEFHFDDDGSDSSEVDAQAEPPFIEEPDDEAAEALDLDQEDASDMALSFDEDIDLQLDEKFDATAFDLEEPEEIAEDEEILDFGDEASEIKEAAAEEFAVEEMSDSDWEETEKGLEDVNFEELPEMDESFELGLPDDDGSVTSSEEPERLTAKDAEAFPGKAVIVIDDDQVIDLGDEHDLEEAALDEFAEFSEEAASPEEVEPEAEMDLAGLEADAQKILSTIVAGQTAEEDVEALEQEPVEDVKEEQFMAALEDVDIDLEEDVVEMFDMSEEESEMALAEPMPEALEEPLSETTPGLSDDLAELQAQSLEAEMREEGLAALDSEVSFQEWGLPVSGEDQLTTLGLVPRLTDAEVEKFEHLVTEAKTLEFYAEKLTTHQSEIMPRIYQKLSKEYLSRKIEIFREPEFISIRIDVEHDLQEMVAKRSDFATTIARLNEELEEVKVRHLVGEYTDAMLAEKQHTQQADILEWQKKMDALGVFIERYQTLLETAHVLNPLEEEAAAEASEPSGPTELPSAMEPAEPLLDESLSEAELAADESLADVFAELPSLSEEDTELTAEPVPSDEADALETPEVIAENLDHDMEDLETLTSIFDEEDSSEWEAEAEEDATLSPEDFDEQEFNIDSGTEDEEDFEIENFAELEEDELSSQLAVSEDEAEEEASTPEPTIICKKCGRATPAAEKFCVNCGAKAR